MSPNKCVLTSFEIGCLHEVLCMASQQYHDIFQSVDRFPQVDLLSPSVFASMISSSGYGKRSHLAPIQNAYKDRLRELGGDDGFPTYIRRYETLCLNGCRFRSSLRDSSYSAGMNKLALVHYDGHPFAHVIEIEYFADIEMSKIIGRLDCTSRLEPKIVTVAKVRRWFKCVRAGKYGGFIYEIDHTEKYSFVSLSYVEAINPLVVWGSSQNENTRDSWDCFFMVDALSLDS